MKRRSSDPKSRTERRVRFVEQRPLAWPWLVILFAASVALLLFFGAALVWLAPP